MMNRLVLFLCFLTVIIAQEINFGYYPLKSHPNLIEIANELKNYIEKNSLLKLNLIIPKDQKTFIDDLKNNKYDFAYASPYSFIISKKKNKHLTPSLILLQKNGKPYFRCKFITHKNSGILSFDESSEKSFAWGKEHSMSANLIPKYILKLYNISHNDTSSDLYGLSSDEIISAIENKYAQVGSIHEDIPVSENIRVLKRSFPIPEYCFVINNKTINNNTHKLLKNAILSISLKTTPELMKRFSKHHKGFAVSSIKDFKRLYSLISRNSF